MSTCAGGRFQGEAMVFEVVPIDGTTVTSATDPETILEANWLEVGLVNSKNYTLTFNTVDGTTDNDGPVPTNIVTGYTFECSVSGLAADDDTVKINQLAIETFALEAVNAGGCPKFWVRIQEPGRTIIAHTNVVSKTVTGGAPKDLSTFDMSFSATATGTPSNDAVRIVPAA